MKEIEVTAVNHKMETVTVTPTAVGVSTITGEYNTSHTYTVTRTGYVTKTGTWTATKNETINVVLDRQSYTLTITVPDQTKYTSGVLKINGSAVTVSGNKYTGSFKYEDQVKIEYTANGIESYINTVTMPASNQSVDIANLANYIEYDIGIDREPSSTVITYSINGGTVQTDKSNSIDGLRYNDVVVWNATAEGYVPKTNQTITITQNVRLDVIMTPQNYNLTVKVPNQTKYTGGALKIDGTTVTVASNSYTKSAPFGSSVKIEYTANGISAYTNTVTIPVGGITEDIAAKAKKITYTKNIMFTPTNGTFKWEYEGDGTPSQQPDTAAGTCRIGGDLHYNDKIKWTLSATGHTSKSGTITVTSGSTENIDLVPINYTITWIWRQIIGGDPMPANMKLQVNGQNVAGSGSSDYQFTHSAPYGSSLSYVATADGMEDIKGTITVSGNRTIELSFIKKKYTLTINPTPSDATVKFS